MSANFDDKSKGLLGLVGMEELFRVHTQGDQGDGQAVHLYLVMLHPDGMDPCNAFVSPGVKFARSSAVRKAIMSITTRHAR